jgi:hypothetical protein
MHKFQDLECPFESIFSSCDIQNWILQLHENECGIHLQDVGDLTEMAPFMVNIAQMEMENMARAFGNKQLRNQNVRLEGLIRECVRDKTVTGEVLKNRHSNPLLTIKGPTYVVVDR